MADDGDTSAPSESSPRPSSSQSSTFSSADAPKYSATARPQNVMTLLMDRRVDLALNVVRIFVIIFSISHLFGIGGSGAYSKALLAMAGASALRLYQRSREPAGRGDRSLAQTFQHLIGEDSCHYLMYCLLFLIGSPLTMVLFPICIFAFLHSMTFFTKLAREMNFAMGIMGRVGRFLEAEQQRMLMTAAIGEIMMMVVSVVMVFTGRITMVAPFMYYRFLQLRYRSRRNPYCRTAFSQLRGVAERLARQSPSVVANIITKGIGIVSHLAPQPTPAQ